MAQQDQQQSGQKLPSLTFEERVALEREYAKAALSGIMVHASQNNWSEQRVAEWAWRVARELVETEGMETEQEPPPPPPPVYGRRR